ncbi:MAG: hypothetical protein IPI57_15810 [Candidatus Competibacteraceae bacterium]|nr:hypothetical protein [Candidatus Competibacteraceae bacterium]
MGVFVRFRTRWRNAKAVEKPTATELYPPNRTYFKKPEAKSAFDRYSRQRSDTFSAEPGYWPTIFHAPRQNVKAHGLAKNQAVITDILGSFTVRSVIDPFAGSGTTGMAAYDLGLDCLMIEKDKRFTSQQLKSYCGLLALAQRLSPIRQPRLALAAAAIPGYGKLDVPPALTPLRSTASAPRLKPITFGFARVQPSNQSKTSSPIWNTAPLHGGYQIGTSANVKSASPSSGHLFFVGELSARSRLQDPHRTNPHFRRDGPVPPAGLPAQRAGFQRDGEKQRRPRHREIGVAELAGRQPGGDEN